MADNTILEAVVTPGDTIATDEIAGAKHQRCKVSLGSDGSATDWPLGQQLMAASAPVVIASNQSAVAVADAAAEASLAAIATQVTLCATSLGVIDDWDETDRAKVNPIVGQAGVAAGAGAVGVTVQRVTLASDDPAVVSLAIVDDWDESDRAKVNPIVGQAGVAAGAGAVSASVQRTTLASDDPAVVALQIIDDWDEADRAKTNPIVGQAGVAAGSGATGASTQRVVLSTDSPGVAPLELLDDTVKTDDAAFTPAVDKVAMVGATFDDVAPDSVNEGDAGALRMSANRNLYTTIRDAAGNERGLNVDANGEIGIGAIRTSVTPGTSAAHLGKAEDAAHASGDVGVMALGVRNDSTAQTTLTSADGDYSPLATDLKGNALAVGNLPHDAPDVGNPLKVGSRVQDYEPDADATESGGLAEVAEGDRANLSLNRRGELIEGVNTQRVSLSALNTTYDDSPTTATSSSVECWNYRWATVSLTIDSTNTPTDIQIDVEVSQDGTNFAKLMNGPLGLWIYDDTATATAISRALSFPICAYKIRVTITCTGTTAANTFAVTNAMLFLRN